ncbi:unnamed protein product [Cuscuta campestris]|uniref:Ubiquitin-like protease family profile domain-containing protein n=1 Tax=Cuscuta campestris TaxID=132261 RepID=A0A484L4R9_9ASTE|nr:unnamed protein product [Cuscuta campestris]
MVNADHFQAQYTCYSELQKSVDIIKKKLTPLDLGRFKKESPFGHLLESPPLQFSGQIIHLLLVHLTREHVDDELRFNIGGSILKFDYGEWCRIIGMPSTKLYGEDGGDEDEDSALGRIRKKFLGNDKGKTTFAHVRKCFHALDEENGGDEVFQFAKLFFAESVLLARVKGTGVEMSHLHLLGSAHKFNAYPWGWESYLLTVRHLKAAMEGQPARFLSKQAENPNMKTCKFSFYGFPYVLQVWAYEQFPQLKGVFADFHEEIVGCPFLKWGSKKFPQYNQLKELILGKDEGNISKKLEYAIHHLVSEVVHMREVMDAKFGDLKVKIQTLSKKVDVLLKKKKKRTHNTTQATEEAEEDEEVVGDSDHEQVEEDIEEEEVVDIEEEEVEDENEGVDEDSGHEECKEEVGVEVEEDEESIRQRNNRKRSRVVDDGEPFEEKETELPMPSPPGIENPQKDLEEATAEVQGVILGLYEDKLIDTQEYARQVLSPGPVEFVYEQAEDVEPPTKTIAVTKPLARETRLRKKSREWEQFKCWVEEEDEKNPNKLRLQCHYVHEVDRHFFRTLLGYDLWLSSDHVQTIVELLMAGVDLIGVQGRCLYGPMFTKSSSDHAWLRDKMLRKLDWTQMEKVFMTIHARNRHWVLAELDFPNATIWVYDSLKNAQSKSYVRPILERLPPLFQTVKTTEQQRRTQAWTVEFPKDVPQQSDGNACGVMIFAFAEYLLAGLPLLPDCTYEHVDDFRRQYAARIYRKTVA